MGTPSLFCGHAHLGLQVNLPRFVGKPALDCGQEKMPDPLHWLTYPQRLADLHVNVG